MTTDFKFESLERCPACESRNLRGVHEDVRDWIFGVSGTWMYSKCIDCSSILLNPRPDENTIVKAYENYYTHKSEIAHDNMPAAGLRYLVRGLANGYRNSKFKARRVPAYKFGAFLINSIPTIKDILDHEFRYLNIEREGYKVLDYGCGNGAFLEKLKNIGCTAVGIDFDESAISHCKEKDLDAYHADFGLHCIKRGDFDAVTLSHVIEHIHEPFASIALLADFLKPGGHLYIETPNSQSILHTLFGKYWRGLEAPRHLVIFSPVAIRNLLERCGFTNICIKHPYLKLNSSLTESIFNYKQSGNARNWMISLSIKAGQWFLKTIVARLAFRHSSDIIVIVARKPL